MAKEKQIPNFNDQKIDLEIDFKDRGGVQRFSKVSDLGEWFKKQREFWQWIGQAPQNQFFRRDEFLHIISDFNNLLQRFSDEWNNIQNQIVRHKEQQSASGESNNVKTELNQLSQQANQVLHGFGKKLRDSLESHVFHSKNYIFSHEPEAQFISELAKQNPVTAIHALDYFLKEKKKSDHQGVEKAKGYLLAGLFRAGVKSSEMSVQAAFQESIQTWSRELEEYRSRYEDLKSAYEGLKNNNRQTTKRWEAKTEDMGKQFDEQLHANAQDLENLKETYEAFMVLKGPMRYWGMKRKDHDKEIKKLRRMLVTWSCVGAGVLFAAAYFLLPEFHPAENIPWRQIGFFILTSTFVLWFIRLLVKLLLSNIHLSADAREREVMIQTFMALMRHKESRDGVTKKDIALVLAPIFKPSTTGVIKDEGGPITLSDFIARLGGK